MFRSIPSTLLAPLVLASLGVAQDPRVPDPLARELTVSGDAFGQEGVSELFIGRSPGARVLYFRLDRDATGGDSDPGAKPAGVARWVRTPGRGFGEHRSELELNLFDSGTLASHVETILPGERKLVWREVRPRGRRTLLLSGASSHGFSLVDATGGEVRRSELRGERGLLPLELVESVQGGQVFMGSFSIFQPLSGAFEHLDVVTREGRDEDGYSTRDLLVRGPEGDVRARYRFRRGELFQFSWRDDGPRARRISGDEYERLVGAHVVEEESVSLLPEERKPTAPTPTLEGPNEGR